MVLTLESMGTAYVVGFLVYFLCTVLLLIAVSMKAYHKRGHSAKKGKNGIKDFWLAIKEARRLYSAVMVHLWDTASDYVVIIWWSKMALEEISGKRDYKNVNMLSFVIPSVVLILIYRIIYAIRYWIVFKSTMFRTRWDIALILLDLFRNTFSLSLSSSRYT